MDFQKIWKRVQNDHKNDHFLKNQLEFEIFEKNFPSWSKELQAEIESGSYSPKTAYICDVPKAGGLIRPGTQLTASDNVYYTALVSEAYESIYNFIKWSQQFVDYGYILTGDNKSYQWLKNHFQGVAPFREKSLELINAGFEYVIIADVTGFYENINHQILQSDMRAAGITSELTLKIIRALQKWSLVNGKGIPQSCSASHILAKLYLNPIDLALQNSNFVHLRYVDDIRIFCKTKVEAKLALVELSIIMRERGLTLNSAKTRIYSVDEAKRIIDGVSQTIEKIKEQLKENDGVFDFMKYFQNDYVDHDTIEQLFKLNDKPSAESVQVLEEAFRINFIENAKDFDKTLFRFLLSRLGEAKSKYAIDYCYCQFEQRAEETSAILTYYLKCGAFNEAITAVLDFFQSGQAIYEFQNHQIISWFTTVYDTVPANLINVVRDFVFNSKHSVYLRTSAIKFIGKFGNIADIERLQHLYSETNDELEQAQIICSLNRMEAGKRNNFYSKVQSDSHIKRIAVEIAKQNR